MRRRSPAAHHGSFLDQESVPMFKTADAEARLATANEIAALLRAQYVASGDRAYQHAASIALSKARSAGSPQPDELTAVFAS